MIDVKIIKKPKNKATTPTVRTPGAAYGDKSVKEAVHASKADTAKMAEKASLAEQAEHAKKADEATRADEVSLESKTLTHFLRNDIPNTAAEVVTFLKGVIAKAVSFFQGIVNKGDINNDGNIKNTGNINNTGDINNSGNVTTKNLTVTGKATFFELEILKAKAAGGILIQSAGTFKVDDCEETPEGYVCYQLAEKDGKTLSQTCEMGDQMLCCGGLNETNQPNQPHQPNQPNQANISNHFYWRLVTEAPTTSVRRNINGEEVECLKIVLSKTDFAEGSDKPKVGDELAQVGNRDNKERQSVIMTCAYKGLDGDLKTPYWVQYTGVNTYELSKFKRTWFAANGSQVTGNFKVQSDNGGLESIEDYVKGLATEKGKDTVVWQVAFSIRHITDKQDETFRLKVVRIVGDKAEEVDYATIYAAGADLLVFGDNMGAELRVEPGVDYLTAEYSHSRYLMARVVRYDTDITLAQDTIYTDVEGGKDGRDGKDAVSYKLIPISEIALAYISENKETKVKTNKVDLKLEYKIQKTVGEQVSFTTLGIEGMTLTLQPSVEVEFSYESYSVSHVLEKREMTYVEISDNSYTVTLKKGSDIVDQRIVPIKLKPSVAFDIDTVNGEIRSEIKTVDGKVNSFKATIDETSNTVGNLEKEFTQMKLTSKEISFTVNNGTRPNLLWGSDLNLDGVDTTSKAAIQKHLGVELNATKTDSKEWFEYLKGGGVSGADALKFKAMKDTAEFAGLFWEVLSGGTRNLKLKPNTLYTLSAWVRTEFDKNAQGYGVFAFEAFKKEKEDSAQRAGKLSFKTASAWFEPINEWTRVSTTFTTEELRYGSVAMWMNGTKPATLYICHPKLEEGDTATPWCAYDGTVEGLKRTGIDIESGEITLDAEKTTVKGDLTAKSLQTEGDPAKGGATIVAKGGMFTVYGVNKSVPGMEIGLNEAGEPVLKMYKNGKFMYDLGPDTIFEQVIERENALTSCDMHRICNTAGNDMEKSFGGDFPNNYRKMVAYVFSEGYKRVGNQTRYKVSETNEISTYNGVHFAEQRSVSVITANELESMSRIADGWYLNGGGPRVSDPSEPAYDGSNPQGYTCRRFGVRYYSNGKATSKLGSFTVCGNSQTGWTVEKIDIPFLNSQI